MKNIKFLAMIALTLSLGFGLGNFVQAQQPTYTVTPTPQPTTQSLPGGFGPQTQNPPAEVKPATEKNKQTSPSPSAKKPEKVNKVIVRTTVKKNIEEVPTLEAKIPNLESQPSLADIGAERLKTVQLNGSAESKKGQKGYRANIEWTTVSRSDTGQSVTIETPMTSNIQMKGTTIPAKTRVTAKGDAEALYNAIRALFDNKQQGDQVVPQQNKKAENKGGGGGNGGGTPSASGTQQTNGDVSANKSSEKKSSEKEEDLDISINTTTEGCSTRIDLAQGYVIQQEATITTTNGKQSKGQCEDGSIRWPIQKTAAGCEDQIGQNEVQGNTRLYYIDASGSEKEVRACQADSEYVYPIVEETGTCQILVDYNGKKATDQAERIYRNYRNVRIVVEECHPIGNGYPITATTDGCTPRTDGTTTYEQSRLFYTKNGQQYFVSTCADNNNTLAIKTTTDGCSIRVDLAQGYAIQQEAIVTTKNGVATRGQCQDSATRYSISKTSLNCTDIIGQNNVSGQTRRYYRNGNGQEIEVNACQTDPEYNYQLVDEAGTCQTLIDFNNKKVSDQVETIYRNYLNNRIVVKECHPTGTGYSILATTDGCSARQDGNTTYEQSRLYYTKNGQQNFVSSCADNNNTLTKTVEGCSIRIDLAQGYAIQQEAIVTTKNGVATRGQCQDSATRFTITKTELSCHDNINGDTANGQTRSFYKNASGQEIEVNACQNDPELIYPIVAETGSCQITIDEAAGRAFEQTERIYRNKKNARIVVENCKKSGDGYLISQTTAGCTPRKDGLTTYEQSRKYYNKNGTQNFISNCADNGNTIQVTTEGCSIRMDIAQGFAIQQEATITTVNGVPTKGTCQDSSKRWSIKKTALSCEDIVGTTSAQGQTRLYYIDDLGKEQEVTKCQPDTELVYPIVSETGECPILIEQSTAKAFDQQEKIYRNSKNVRILVKECAKVGSGYPITETADGCQLRDDFTNKVTYRQVRTFYTKSGVQYFTSTCTDKNSYPHVTEACADIVDQSAGKVFKASRIYINGPSGKEYRSYCAPNGQSTGLQESTAGCEAIHYDYPSTEQSRGASRLYYVSNGQTIYLTECTENTTIYPWMYELTGYQHDDDKKESTQLSNTYINLPSGKVYLAQNTVAAGAPKFPYTLKEVQNVPTQPKTYQGCNAYSPSIATAIYERIDNTTYSIAQGPGPYVGPIDECVRTQQTVSTFSHGCYPTSNFSADGPDCKSNGYDLRWISYAGQDGIDNTNRCGGGGTKTGKNFNAVQQITTTRYPDGSTTNSTIITGYAPYPPKPTFNIFWEITCKDGNDK